MWGPLRRKEVEKEKMAKERNKRHRPRKHQCIVLGCYSTGADTQFHRVNTKGGQALLEKILQKGWEVKSTAKSSRICSRHSTKPPGSYLTTNAAINSTIETADRHNSTVEALNRKQRKTVTRSPSPKPSPKQRCTPSRSHSIPASATENEELQVKLLLREAEISLLKEKITELQQKLESQPERRFQNLELGLNPTGNFSDPKDAKYWTGIERLDDLWQIVEPVLSQQLTPLQKLSISNGEKKRYSALKEHFFALLVWLRRGLRLSDFTGNTKVAKTKKSVKLHFFWIIDALSEWTKGEVYLPTVTEWMSVNNRMTTGRGQGTIREEYPNNLFLFVDGSVIDAYKPSDADGKSRHFNSKHKKHCRAFTILASAEGKIRWITRAYDGGVHDVNAWHYSEDPCTCPGGLVTSLLSKSTPLDAE